MQVLQREGGREEVQELGAAEKVGVGLNAWFTIL